jgi:tetratricopeptide (TPR) repeat protein
MSQKGQSLLKKLTKPRGWAFIAGVSKYNNDSFKQIPCDSYVYSLIDALLKDECYQKENIVALASSPVENYRGIKIWESTRNNILFYFGKFLDKLYQNSILPNKRDSILIFLFGHGGTYDGKNLFFPKDACILVNDPKIISETSIEIGFIKEKFNRHEKSSGNVGINVFVFIDACKKKYSNVKEKKEKEENKSKVTKKEINLKPEWYKNKDIDKIISLTDNKIIKDSPSGISYIFSCQEDNYSFYLDEASFFSEALIKVFDSFDPKKNNYPILFGQLEDYVVMNVTEIAKGYQRPGSFSNPIARSKKLSLVSNIFNEEFRKIFNKDEYFGPSALEKIIIAFKLETNKMKEDILQSLDDDEKKKEKAIEFIQFLYNTGMGDFAESFVSAMVDEDNELSKTFDKIRGSQNFIVWYRLGLDKTRLKDYEKARYYYETFLESIGELNNIERAQDEKQRKITLNVLNNLGEIYHYIYRNFDKAKEYYEMAKSIDRKNQILLYNLGNYHQDLKDLKQAKEFFSESVNVDILQKTERVFLPAIINLSIITSEEDIRLAQRELKKAIKINETSNQEQNDLPIIPEFDNPYYHALAIYNLAFMYNKSNDKKKRKRELRKAASILTNIKQKKDYHLSLQSSIESLSKIK